MSGTITISLKASKAYVDGIEKDDQIIGEIAFDGLKIPENTSGNITKKNGVDFSSILPSSINETNINDYFTYVINGDKVEGATYSWSIVSQDDEAGEITLSLVASEA